MSDQIQTAQLNALLAVVYGVLAAALLLGGVLINQIVAASDGTASTAKGWMLAFGGAALLALLMCVVQIVRTDLARNR